MLPTNLAFMRIAKRAERQDDTVLQRTFVDFGAVFVTLSSIDSQIVFGRRGTGKTHLLTVLRQSREQSGDVAIQLDMRNIGSSGGIYADATIPLPERATRLLVDVLAAIHGRILSQVIESGSRLNLADIGPSLDELLDSIRTVRVKGNVSVERIESVDESTANEGKVGINATMTGLGGSGEYKRSDAAKNSHTTKLAASGQGINYVNFGSVGTALDRLANQLQGGRLWILIDEWSEVPVDLQPYLADLIRRAIFPVRNITVKIAAIEQRCRFRIVSDKGDRLGIELGSDLSPAVNLDDFMVFDNDEQKAVSFFKSLVFKHVQVALEGQGVAAPSSQSDLISQGFTQANAFSEVVRACEGVPRDAIHILSHAAQRAGTSAISVSTVRDASQQWYQGSKDAAVSANEQAKSLLLWIVDKVIKGRQTKAFLLEAGSRDSLIDFLYDERVLHVLRRGMSSKDSPGKRFNVYAIDYGCYVDLVNTRYFPKGLLDFGVTAADYSDSVPLTDFRSIRRCILDLNEFYASMPSAVA